ncbi:hypothetical protein B0T26DRAFT_725164 [Lasiosphaeria miniovina]|uniref:Uncharacterized protein n=1 Tax=Lasiosphaeria miniovina TaxID=1954250 RepID=A0AA40DJK8_9PEZI|nr:uncharacterized protein B0T26DRAFT_725164 [Lasiosphaeria miniovina]KAK0705994.1 hypothetical protein B0T26DRAFT_725164 [Lasiosphaeria miniovina]
MEFALQIFACLRCWQKFRRARACPSVLIFYKSWQILANTSGIWSLYFFWNISARRATRENPKEDLYSLRGEQCLNRAAAARIYGALCDKGLKFWVKC